MTVGSTNRIDAFQVAREAAAKRIDAYSPAKAAGAQPRNGTQSLTGSVSARDHLIASQATQVPLKGQRVDFLA